MNPVEMMAKGAHFSECGQYRYWLIREVNDSGNGALAFCMLNPSTADAKTNDPTVSKCCRIAKRLGYRYMVVVNLFALRATDPADMKKCIAPVGAANNTHIMAVARLCDRVICAWGTDGRIWRAALGSGGN